MNEKIAADLNQKEDVEGKNHPWDQDVKFLQSIILQSPAIIYIRDQVEDRIIWCNPTMEEAFG
ncbi:MAG: PAS domain-containing protein, partial [Chitinophagaceae bacterium]